MLHQLFECYIEVFYYALHYLAYSSLHPDLLLVVRLFHTATLVIYSVLRLFIHVYSGICMPTCIPKWPPIFWRVHCLSLSIHPLPYSFLPLILHFKHRSTISHVDDDTKSPETVTRDRVEQRPLGIAVRSLVLLRYDATVDEGP